MIEDEWYLVSIEDKYKEIYYKCDQIEGIEHLLTDLFEKTIPSAKMIDDYKKVNESMSDYEDFLFSFFDKDPSFIDQEDSWIYVEYNQFVNPSESLVQADIMYEKLKRYLSGPRFNNLITKSEMDYGDFYVLIVNKDFYNKHIKVENLNWEQHDLAKHLGDFAGSFRISDAKAVKGLPNNCSLIRGLNFSGGIEFWPKDVEPDPIYVKNNIELQYLLYKHTL